jgi:thiamine biosynthesis lipoprotein
LQRVLALVDEALATSGDRVNGYLSGGRHYSHLINPRHSEPLDTAPASVSVHANKVLSDNRVSDSSIVEMNGQLVGLVS